MGSASPCLETIQSCQPSSSYYYHTIKSWNWL
jgi:hypothetical protein